MLNQLLFLFNVSWIFVSEFLKFFIFNDRSAFIDRLTMRLASVNVLYVKVFQAIALNNNFIDEITSDKLTKFTDNAPWTQCDIDADALSALGDEYGLKFEDGIDHPMKSGMISLVFKAYMDDTPVIVKIKRKNIEYQLLDALSNLLFFASVISFIPAIGRFKLTNIILNT